MRKVKQNLKHYLISSLITFLTGFLTVLSVSIDKINIQNFEVSALIGLFLVAVRAGFKVLLEKYLQKLMKIE